jgi:hypothetical protein
MDQSYNNIIELVSQKKFEICENFILKNINDINFLIDFVDQNFKYFNESTQLIFTKIIIKIIYKFPNIFLNYYKSYTLFKKLLNFENLKDIITNFINYFEENEKNLFYIKKFITYFKNNNSFSVLNNFKIDNNDILSSFEQFQKIIDINIMPFVYSIYDKNVYHNTNFITRIKFAKNDTTKKINVNEIEKRLIIIYKFFGQDFLLNYNIKIISNKNFYKLSYQHKILYFKNTITSLTFIFRKIHYSINEFKIKYNKIINLVNYDDFYIIKFNSDSTSENDLLIFDNNYDSSPDFNLESTDNISNEIHLEIKKVLDDIINIIVDNQI